MVYIQIKHDNHPDNSSIINQIIISVSNTQIIVDNLQIIYDNQPDNTNRYFHR